MVPGPAHDLAAQASMKHVKLRISMPLGMPSIRRVRKVLPASVRPGSTARGDHADRLAPLAGAQNLQIERRPLGQARGPSRPDRRLLARVRVLCLSREATGTGPHGRDSRMTPSPTLATGRDPQRAGPAAAAGRASPFTASPQVRGQAGGRAPTTTVRPRRRTRRRPTGSATPARHPQRTGRWTAFLSGPSRSPSPRANRDRSL
jgi:hypothetical protein